MTTVGGGADGHALASIAAAAALPPGLGHLIVAGPQMPEPELTDLRRHATHGVRIVEALDDMVLHMRHAEAIVSMAGYNTVCELMSTQVPALVVPRNHSRAEQQIRAASLADAGYLDSHDMNTLTPAILAGWLAQRVGTRTDRRTAKLNGLARVPQLAAALLRPALRTATSRPGTIREGAAHVAV
jgi:predicted glycosyltransferase